MDVTFLIVLDGLQPHKLNIPEGGEIAMNLGVSVCGLDVVLCDAYPPTIKSIHVKFITDRE